jgi:hypothetical protein
MQQVIFSIVNITALLGTTLVLVPAIPIYTIVAACDRRHRRALLVPLAMVCGCGVGGLLIWSLVAGRGPCRCGRRLRRR